MENWKRTLWVLWTGQFCLQAGVSLIAPFLPLYLGEMGVSDPGTQAIWSGIIFATNYVIAAIFQPIWGSLGDKYGRKKMALRSAFGIGAAVGLYSVATSPWMLEGFRILHGAMIGYGSVANAIMSSQAPKDKQGYALGTLQTGVVAGTVCGPLIGGLLSHLVGSYRVVFLITLVTCWLAGILTWIFIKDEPAHAVAPAAPVASAAPAARQKASGSFWAAHPLVVAMVVVIFLSQFGTMTVEPTLSLFLQTLDVPEGALELYAGVVFAASGFASFLAAPQLGKLGDRFGHRKVLACALAGSAAVYFLQGLVTEPWQLVILRFLAGVGVGGIVPAANATIGKMVASNNLGRGYGWSLSATFWGNVAGPIAGSLVASGFHSQRAVFPATGLIMLISLLWLLTRVPAQEGGVSRAQGAYSGSTNH